MAGLLLTPILLFLILAVLLYLPPVQNWVVDKVAATVSEKTGMDITVGHVNLEWPLDLGIDDFLAINHGDTLADVNHLTANVKLRPLLQQRIVIKELSLSQVKLNTNGFISDVQVKGSVGELWLRSNGIDLKQETVEVNGARLTDANLDIALGDTAAVDTTTSEVLWKINADSIAIHRTAIAIHLPGDTLNIDVYMGRAIARQAGIDLGTSTYKVNSFDWTDGRLSYNDDSQPTIDGLDYNHISLADIRFGVDSIYYGPLGTSLYIRETALKEKSGLQVTELTGGIRLDTTFTHIELPHLTLRTPDSDIEAEVNTDFTIADSLTPGKMYVRLNAQLGKQDLMRFAGGMPQQFIHQYPNHPLSIQGSVNGNVKRMEVTGLNIQLPTALHIKADGYAYNITDLKQLRGQVIFKAETYRLGFVNALVPIDGLRLPPMTLNGNFNADGRNYNARLTLREGKGTVKADISTSQLSNIANYQANLSIREMNLYHFLPQDSLYANTADMTADLNLKKGYATGIIAGHNNMIDGQIGIEAQVSNKYVEATITPKLAKADLFLLKVSDKPLTVGMNGTISLQSDMKQSHEVRSHLTGLYIMDEKATYHPEDIGLYAKTNRDTTLARIQSGDFIVKFDASGGYEYLMKQGTVLLDSVMTQYENKVIDQPAIKRLLPTATLHIESSRNNPIANILRTKEIDFHELFVTLNTSPNIGINGQMHVYSLIYDSVRIDTVRLNLTQRREQLAYHAQIRNNRRNPQFVFNVLIDGHVHEHGALAGLRYYDDKERLGVRLGATASMVDEGIRFELMPKRPTIGYKEFNLNSDNFILLGKKHRLQAKVDLIADDKTGMKIYTEDQDSTALQDLTVSLHRVNLDEVTSVMPYLPRMSGLLNGDYHIVQDENEHISVVSDMAVTDMTYEGAPIGNLSTELVYMQREDEAHAVEARLMLNDDEFGLLQGTYKAASEEQETDDLDATFTMTRLPLSLVNGFIPDQIIGLDGYGEGELTIKGMPSKPDINGEIYLDSAYLVSHSYGVRMRFDNDPVRIVGSHLLFENFGLYAYNDQPLNIQGDIDFSDVGNINMNMRMRAQNLQLINAKQETRSVAFGKAFVNFFANLTGPLEALKMRGRLDVLGSTDLTYMLLDSPLSTDNRLEELVKFTDFSDTTQTSTTTHPVPSGIDVDLTLNVSQGAHIVCNLNMEQTNYIDLMGGGELRLRYGNNGLALTGRYTLSNGEMKYSLPIIPLKTFTIQDGSYVEFTGDPMNPRLNITATERIKSNVGQEGTQGRSVAFDCGVVITKTLNDMGLQFTISAPEDNNINGELQAMSEEERGKLAVTMLTTGMYLADGNTNSFSMNSVLSAYLQNEINNITGSALKTLDLSVGLDNTTDATGASHTDYSFKFSKRLFDNRLKIQIGGKVSSGQSEDLGQKQSFFDNVTMEYRLDQNSTKNVKLFYIQNVYDWLDGYTDLYGGGFVWRKKMNSLLDVFKIFSSDTQQPMMMRRDSTRTDTLRNTRP